MSDEDDPRDDADAEEQPRRRSRLEALIPDLIRKAIAQGAGALTDEKLRDQLVSDVVRKAISVGSDVVDTTEDQVRRLLGELPLPKEVGDRLANKLDDYKGELFRLVKQEVHEFLEHVDLGAELQKILTSLSFEIVTEIRFIPNEKSAGSAVKPDVKSSVKLKRSEEDEKPRGRRSKRPRKAEGET